ncbi:hypothetical protein [Jeotgalibacillus marinus]|uniref:DUF5105 domain-containing protein n=1 Tax=Jeotgalibacillus marinus TaxID=86667 RepID=A0ABV3Q688_9BACL
MKNFKNVLALFALSLVLAACGGEEESSEPQTAEETIISILHDEFKETNSFNDEDSILDMTYDEETGSVEAEVYAKDNIVSIKGSIEMAIHNILKEFSEDDRFNSLTISAVFPFSDAYGNSTFNEIYRASFSEETIEKVNWEKFLWDDTPNIADDLFVHNEIK